VGLVVAAAAIVVETVTVLLLKQMYPKEAFGTLYLLGVFVVSTVWGVGLAMAMSVVSAIALDYFRDWPTIHFMPFELEDGVVITVFLVVALAANFVAGLARTRAVEADQRRREADVLAEQQAALRRVATLIAHGISPSEIYAAVAEETARCLNMTDTEVARYDGNDAAIIVASHGLHALPRLGVGERVTLEGDNVAAMVLRTARAARMDNYKDAAGSLPARVREVGIRSVVAAPVTVDGRVWGAVYVASRRPQPMPADTEKRVADFADLVATALANAATRAELIASRARIVTAADNARRGLERDLHDGAQQRLVSVGLQIRALADSIPTELDGFRARLSAITDGMTGVSNDLQRISRGIHPAILSTGGLGAALKTLARHSAVPANVDLHIEARLSAPAEIAAYYLVAEALTNVAKHAQASEVNIRVASENGILHVQIRDDGVGGANARKGSGLIGLKDRVEALGGRMEIISAPGRGTSLFATIPVAIESSGSPY